ncbi:probable disease resistance protein At4g27220 [Gossypium hirsutum]|uniref:Probable disease resistance protein At4g27220 n=1 Tax=Gossypium hirsutum TaxID=3635 RepID=A0A1U8M4E5_GOSHI|nr:probable disease resistance protein At4g27220 [Gossypium hirsutum]
MDCKIVKVHPLSNEESMNLFLVHTGLGVLKVPSLEQILGDIVRECNGLPLAIAVIAGSMKGIYDVAEWRNALRELRDHVRSVKGTNDEIYRRLKFSFNHLGDFNIQNCFIYCSLYLEDYIIPRMELIEYWIDEGFLEIVSRQQSYDRGVTILNRLVNNCLLEKATGGVKMHDVMRDTALYIKRLGPRFMIKAGTGLKELPSTQEWKEDFERVSFMMNKVSDIPPSLSPNCENLLTLLLHNNKSLGRISESFFQHMHSLSILDLSYTYIQQLPNSMSNLEKLNALVLRGCEMLRYLPSLEKLKALRKLDLRDTGIEKVLEGLEMLANLTYLDLATKSLKELPIAILPWLSCTEAVAWAVSLGGGCSGVKGKWGVVAAGSFRRLKTLGQRLASYLLVVAPAEAKFDVNERHQLLEYDGCWVKAPEVMKAVVADKGVESVSFDREKVLVKGADVWETVEFKLRQHGYYGVISKAESSQFPVLLPKKEVILSECHIQREDPVVLLTDLKVLRISKCHNVRSLNDISLFFLQTNELRLCSVEDCKGIESVLDLSSSSSLCSSFEKLEYLWLKRLDNLRVIVKIEASVSIP